MDKFALQATHYAMERERLRGVTDPPADQFLEWVADRLVKVHGEYENVDFVIALRRLAKELNG